MKIFLVLLFLPAFAIAQQRKIETFGLPNGVPIKGEKILSPLKDKDISFSGIIVEKTELTEIISKFGHTEIQHTGDAGESNSSICYFGAGDAAIRFNSGEMGGGKVVTTIEVFDKKYANTSNCVMPNKGEVPVANENMIKLGLSKGEILKKFGKASFKVDNDNWSYDFSSKLKRPKCDGGWDVSEGYKFKFKDNKLISFSVSKVTSC